MKRYLAVFTVSFLVGAGLALASDRTHVDSESSLRVYKSDLISLADGGCAVQAFAYVTASDGGLTQEASRVVEVAGANRTACLDVFTKSLVLFKSTNGF